MHRQVIRALGGCSKEETLRGKLCLLAIYSFVWVPTRLATPYTHALSDWVLSRAVQCLNTTSKLAAVDLAEVMLQSHLLYVDYMLSEIQGAANGASCLYRP